MSDNKFVLYRKYRPKTFDDVLGQEHIVAVLKNQVNSGGTSHAYLFSGTRGTGKTSLARIVAMGLNCLEKSNKPCGKCANCISIANGNFLDVIEIDAASNRGIEDAKQIRSQTIYPPNNSSHKIFIIDEVHMLTREAFNALLKTLEEPPSYVCFMFATTEIDKVPQTILSRCLKLTLTHVPLHLIKAGLEKIINAENRKLDDASVELIAEMADGSVRDGLSLLEKCFAGTDGDIDIKMTETFLGKASFESVRDFLAHLFEKDYKSALVSLNTILTQGRNEREFVEDVLNVIRHAILLKFNVDESVINISPKKNKLIKELIEKVEMEELERIAQVFSNTIKDLKWSDNKKLTIELSILLLGKETVWEKE